MAQFRSSADLIDSILQKAGEVTNGNSPYESNALDFLNRTHNTLVAGGTIPIGKDETIEIDETWPWAKAKSPLVLELQPAYTTGFVTLTLGSEAGTFSSAPSSSLEGYHININGRDEWFKIASHTASSSDFELDGIYPDDTVTGAFRAVKVDYQLVPSYVVINNGNNKIQFQKVSGTTITGTLTNGTYALSDLAVHVAAVMTAATTTITITGSYSTTTRKFSFVSDGAGSTTLYIVGNGSFSGFSAHKILGFDDETSTAGLTQTSTYVFSGISRLVEPFRVHKGSGDGIFGLDADSFHREFPISSLSEGIPDKFCVIREDADGSLTVRFNSYPRSKTRIEVEHVPVPRDLKDNSSSVPLIPRKHVDVLEDAAVFYIMLLKSDDRAQTYAALVSGKLRAMVSQHRGSLIKVGDSFGQITPREDLLRRFRAPKMSYPTPTSTSASGETIQTLITATLGYADFSVAGLTKTVTARTLPANRSLFSIIIKHSQAFAGGVISALTLDVGIATDTDLFITSFNVMQAVSASAQESAIVVYYPGTATGITVTATAVGANLSALSAGSVTLYFQEASVS